MAEAQKDTRTPDSGAGRETQKQTAKEAGAPDRGRQSGQLTRPPKTGVVRHRHPTTPASYGGWGPMARLRDEFDRLFDRFFAGGWPAVPAGRGGWDLDVRDDDGTVTVRAEAPGFEPGDFDIQVRGDQLVMCACRGGAEKEEGGYRGWQRSEFYESVTLPADVDPDKVKAAYWNGVLTVILPKSEQGKARRITVEG